MNERIGTPRLTIHNEVETAPIATLADYRGVTSSEDFSRLMTFAKRLTGKKLVFSIRLFRAGE